MAKQINDGIPEGKKRYTFTLTIETMDKMQKYMKGKHANKALLSALVDDFVADTYKVIEELEKAQHSKGSTVVLGDILTLCGKLMTEKEQRKLF